MADDFRKRRAAFMRRAEWAILFRDSIDHLLTLSPTNGEPPAPPVVWGGGWEIRIIVFPNVLHVLWNRCFRLGNAFRQRRAAFMRCQFLLLHHSTSEHTHIHIHIQYTKGSLALGPYG